MTFRVVRLLHIAAVSAALILLGAPIAAVQSPPSGARTQPLTMKGYPALGAPPIITITNAGAAPRTQLRYVIPANHKARMNVTMRMSMGTSAGTDHPAERDHTTIPTITVTADLGVTSVMPNGDIAYELALSSMTVEATSGSDPRIAQAMQGFVAAIASTRGGGTISSTGVIKSMRLDVAHSEMKKALGPVFDAVEHLAIPVPDAAVGVGARWEVREALEVGGLTTFRPAVFQKTEYEVVSIDGGTVSLRVKTDQKGPPQPLNDPSLPVSNQGIVFGADNRLQNLSGTGTGTVIVQLNSLAPVSERQSTTSMVITMLINSVHPATSTVAGRTIDGKINITIAPPGMAGALDRVVDLKALRGIKAVNLGGTHDSTVGPERVCYPRAAGDPRGGVRIAMGGLLAATTEVLKAAGIETSPRSTDSLQIDAQIHDAVQCRATITLELARGLGTEHRRYAPNGQLIVGYAPSAALWRRVFEITGAPAEFSSRVIDRLKIDVRDFVSDVARANLRK